MGWAKFIFLVSYDLQCTPSIDINFSTEDIILLAAPFNRTAKESGNILVANVNLFKRCRSLALASLLSWRKELRCHAPASGLHLLGITNNLSMKRFFSDFSNKNAGMIIRPFCDCSNLPCDIELVVLSLGVDYTLFISRLLKRFLQYLFIPTYRRNCFWLCSVHNKFHGRNPCQHKREWHRIIWEKESPHFN